MSDFKDVSYLRRGTLKQVSAYNAITSLHILEDLKEFKPLLAGTIPLSIDLEHSDLDFVCEVYDQDHFVDCVSSLYRECSAFKVKRLSAHVVVVNFFYEEFEFELYGENKSSKDANAFRHMLIEDRVLKLLGSDFKSKVIELKKRGLKTEPAFAKLLGLEGNSYQALLQLGNYSDKKIRELYQRNEG